MSADQPSLPPIPEAGRAAELWAVCRTMSTQQAVAKALAEDA